MAQISKTVTHSTRDPSLLPDWASRGCALVADLEWRGMLVRLGERVRIRREGGFSGIDVLLVLLHFFASGLPEGIRPFWRRASPFGQQLAALANRAALPSPASVSRALESVEPALFRPQIAWLLGEVTGADEVLAHPAVTTRDARGEHWHVFHFDPTVTTLRQRPLAQGEQLPEPRRRADEMGAPGYQGRKRGEIVFRRATLQHEGSGLWIHGTLAPGNGDRRAELDVAADVVVATCARLAHRTDRALFVADGEFANVPSYTSLRERNLPFITRCPRYELLDQPAVRRRLAAATWLEVPSDGSGPRRSATDLGVVTVPPGAKTVRADGQPYVPFPVRVVVTRYARTSEPEHGRVIDGWQYELFAVDLDPVAWPAPDAIHAFFGRGGQENRFAQEDRELGLDRIFSYHLPGQEFAAAVGLMVWNLRVVAGFRLARLPTDLQLQKPREEKIDRRACAFKPPEEPEEEPGELVPDTPDAAHAALRNELERVDWSAWTGRHPGWAWDAESARLHCPNGLGLRLVTVTLGANGAARSTILFRAPVGGCEVCPFKPTCMAGAAKATRKQIGITVDTSLAKRIKRRFRAVHGRPLVVVSRRPPKSLPVTVAEEPACGANEIAPAPFLPAEARRTFDEATDDLRLRVLVEAPPQPRWPRLLAELPERRQHRRKTWAEHLDRYALPDGAKIHVDYAAGRIGAWLLAVAGSA